MVPLALLPLLRFVDWLFGKRGGGIDLVLAVPAIGWTALMVLKPDLFDTGSFRGMSWLPDGVWIVLMAAIGSGHIVGVLAGQLYRLRVVTCFASSWIWLSIAISLGQHGVGTGVIVYGELGLMALFGGLYIYSLPKRGV